MLLEPEKKPEPETKQSVAKENTKKDEPKEEPKAEAPVQKAREALPVVPSRPRKKKLSPVTIALTIVAGLAVGYGASLAVRAAKRPDPQPATEGPKTSAPITQTPENKPAAKQDPPKAADPAPSAAPMPSASAAESAAKAAQLSEEEAKDLTKKFKDAFRFHDWRNANRLAVEIGKGAPSVYKDREFVSLVSNLAITLSKENAESDLMNLFADDLGSDGLDMLYAFIEGQGKAPIAVTASKLLADPKRIEKATPAMRVALDFRNASCVERLGMFERAGTEGDARARLALETLGRACFPTNPDLERVINDLRLKGSKR